VVAKLAGVSLATVSNVINGKPGVGLQTRERVLRALKQPAARKPAVSRPAKVAGSTITQKDLARVLGVSRELISRVINDYPDVHPDTKVRVKSAMERLGYRPNLLARSLSRRRTKTIGLLVNDVNLTWREPVFSMIINGVIEVASDSGYAVAMYHYDESRDGRDYGRIISDGRSDGGIVVDNPVLTQPELDRMESLGLPLVFANSIFPGRRIATVHLDNRRGMDELVSHLISLGHRRIVLVTGTKSALLERFTGYRNALDRHGIPFDQQLVCNYDRDPDVDAAVRSLFSNRSTAPTAVCAIFDTDALKWIQLLHQWGYRVPEDVSVAGFDDFPFARLVNPPLTTVTCEYIDVGRACARLLIAKLEGRQTEESVVVPTQLVIRRSTGPAAQRRQ
jgi:DNA-binding LacI/PurR family transcriptional regulator